jgi:hypothetical protein
LVKKLVAADGQQKEYFGTSVAIANQFIAVGAYWAYNGGGSYGQGAVYLFNQNQGGSDNWGGIKKLLSKDGKEGDHFGWSLAFLNDTLAVGANTATVAGHSGRGAIYIFKQNQGGSDAWGEVERIVAADGQAQEKFGSAIALNNDTILVGAEAAQINSNMAQGAVYLFSDTPSTLTNELFLPLLTNP